MAIHDGPLHSTQSVPEPPPDPSKLPLSTSLIRLSPTYTAVIKSESRLHETRSDSPNQNQTTVIEERTNIASGHGSAKRTDRRRRASPPLLVSRIRNVRHEAAHPTVSSVTVAHQGPGLTKSEFEFCRQSLKTVIQRCTDIDFLRLSVIISCLLNCFQALHVIEVTGILALLLGRESGDEDRSEKTEDTIVKQLQVKCSQVFFLDSTGLLHFAHPLIPRFLLAYPIKGIDRSHTLLARACLTQVDFNGGIHEFGVTGIEAMQPRIGPFSDYAAENWQEHYRRAEKGSPSLTAQVHRMLWTEVMKRESCVNCSTSDRDLERNAVSEALKFCIGSRFQILSKSYSRLLIGMDSASSSGDSVEEGSRTFTESSAKVPDLDQALSELQLTESDSDSDSSWSLV